MKKLISASFIVFLKIFEPIKSNGSVKINERFDLKGINESKSKRVRWVIGLSN